LTVREFVDCSGLCDGDAALKARRQPARPMPESKKHPLPILSSILEVIELYSEMVEPVSLAGAVCSDPDDDKFLEAALAADADYVVSGDAALLRLKNYHPIQIVRPAQFLKLLSH
jgi:predicted nucleic acid-binding protein